jgi:hypothetical protein
VFRWSANDVRRIHLDIPSGRPTTGLAAAIEDSGIIPTRDYVHGVHDDGYQGLPIVGLAMSSGPICWAWCIAGLLVIRRRDRAALAVFVPVAILLLTFLAGPVSGGTRYSLSLFMTLPLALAAATLATTRRRGQPSRVTAADTEHEAPAEEAVPEPRVAGNLPHRGGSAAPAAVDKVSESVRSSRDQPIPPDRPDRDRGDDRGASGRRTQ